jgi:hypothetical protein
MKKIIKPAEREESVFYSDFSGKTLGEFGPDVEIKISCGYGSKYDGTEVTLHLDDIDFEKIIDFSKDNISKDFKDETRKKLEKYEKDYDDSMQMRDWNSCDNTINNMWFIRKFLNIKEEPNE